MAYQGFAQYPYGAVYFRKSSPQKQDFARDYAQAAKDGMNTFRHWFMWHTIEIAPGVYDWDEWDMQLDLAAEHGMKTIIAECIHAAPEWVFAEYAHARYQDADGRPAQSKLRNSSATGGFSGLCLDNADFRALAGGFLTTLATRYKGHPGLGGYDVMNETNLWSSAYSRCFCPASQQRFRAWLQDKYGDLKNLAEAWRRYSFTDWSQVQVPRGYDVYPEFFDYADYSMETALENFNWRVATLRAVDPDTAMLAHGVNDASLHRRLDAADDAWEYPKALDGYGHSGGGGLASVEHDRVRRWSKIVGADVTRMGSDGKPFWACERTSGPFYSLSDRRFRREYNENNTWVTKLALDNPERFLRNKPTGEDLRVNDFVQMAAGASGLFSNRWRGLDDGPFFGAMGYYNNDGSPTDRSEAAAVNAKWANNPAQKSLWQSAPVYGDIAILNCPESQVCIQLMTQNTGLYIHALRGLHSAWMDMAVQPDFIKLHQLSHYKAAYLPLPFRLTGDTVDALRAWVAEGGILISEGCPGYMDDHGHVEPRQPARGLDELFGCREADVFIGPETISAEKLTFSALGYEGLYGGAYEQCYVPTTGRAVGTFAGGKVAAIENSYGKGKTLLLGTAPSFGFYENQAGIMTAFFEGLLGWAGITQRVKCSGGELLIRLHDGVGGPKLWAVNMHAYAVEADILLQGTYGQLCAKKAYLGQMPEDNRPGSFHVTVGPKGAVVLGLG